MQPLRCLPLAPCETEQLSSAQRPCGLCSLWLPHSKPQRLWRISFLQEPFKLSKFKRVRAKVTSFRQKSEAAEILDLDIAAQMNEEDPRSKMDSDKLPRDEVEDGLAEH
eukprot:s1998_g7.t1